MTMIIAPVHTSGRRRRAGRQLTHVRPGLRERAQGVKGFGAGQRGVQGAVCRAGVQGAVCGAWRAAVRPPAAKAIEGLQQPGVHHGVTIKIATRPGDLVLDPMCGIGTTLVEASTTRSGILINSS